MGAVRGRGTPERCGEAPLAPVSKRLAVFSATSCVGLRGLLLNLGSGLLHCLIYCCVLGLLWGVLIHV